MAINNPETWTRATLNLRINSVIFARGQLAQGRADIDMLLNFFPDEPDLDAALEQLQAPGQYVQNVGDLMLQIISSFRGQPIILLNISNNNVEFILPEAVFVGEVRTNCLCKKGRSF